MRRGIANVEKLGGNVPFPEPGYAFVPEDLFKCGEGTAVGRARGGGIGKGVCLELEANFDDVERSDDEAGQC